MSDDREGVVVTTCPGYFSKVQVNGQTVARIDAQRDSELWRLSIYDGVVHYEHAAVLIVGG